MTDPDVIEAFQKNLAYQQEFSRKWVCDEFNNELLYKDSHKDILAPFLTDGQMQKKLVPGALRDVATWHMMNAMDRNVNEKLFPEERLPLSALYRFWYQECAHALMESDDPARYRLSYRNFIPVCTMLSLGWPNHAVQMAETLFDRWDVQKDGNGAVPWETFGEYMPWVAIKLYKAWRDSDEEYEYEPEIEQLDGFAPMLEKLLDPSARVFGDALTKAADFHVKGCGFDDYDVVKDEDYWFFPVELLAACRIRQLRGLEVIYVSHPLFDTTPLGRLHSPLPVPRDETLDKILPLFAKAIGGNLDLSV